MSARQTLSYLLGSFVLIFTCLFSIHPAWSKKPNSTALAEFLFSLPNNGKTETILVYQDGQFIFEKSAEGFSQQKPHILWSVAKSVSSLILGILIDENKLNIDDSVCDVAPKFKEKIDCDLKMSAILDWSSGLNFLEIYEGHASRTQSSVGQMLYGDGKKDMIEFILSHKQIYPPGKHFYYSSGDSNLLLGLMKYHISSIEYENLPWKLFEPLNINSAIFERDSAGHWQSGTSLYMSSRDLVKVGQLMLNQGVFENKKIVSSSWVSYVSETVPQFKTSEGDRLWIPARHWWKPHLKNMGLDQIANFPQDIIVGRGHWGQYLIVIPSLKLVAVRFGLDQNDRMNEPQFFKLLVELGSAK